MRKEMEWKNQRTFSTWNMRNDVCMCVVLSKQMYCSAYYMSFYPLHLWKRWMHRGKAVEMSSLLISKNHNQIFILNYACDFVCCSSYIFELYVFFFSFLSWEKKVLLLFKIRRIRIRLSISSFDGFHLMGWQKNIFVTIFPFLWPCRSSSFVAIMLNIPLFFAHW